MQRAQQRDAAASKTFFFRKDVYITNPSAASSVASSGTCSPVDGNPRKKEKKLQNCFSPPPLPEDGIQYGSVEDEYEEMTMKEVMNGKVILDHVFPKFYTSNYHPRVQTKQAFQVFCPLFKHISTPWT